MGLRPRFKTPLSQARDKLLAYAIRPLLVFKPRTRFLIGCSILVILTTLLLLTNRASSFNDNYTLGEVLGRSIVAPSDMTAVDQAETERLKNIARGSTRAVFNFDSSRAESSVQSFRQAWENLSSKQAQARLSLLSGVEREVRQSQKRSSHTTSTKLISIALLRSSAKSVPDIFTTITNRIVCNRKSCSLTFAIRSHK